MFEGGRVLVLRPVKWLVNDASAQVLGIEGGPLVDDWRA